MKLIIKYLILAIALGASIACNANNPVKNISGQSLTEKTLSGTDVKMKGLSSLCLTGSASEVLNGSKIVITDDDSWVFFPNVSKNEFFANNLQSRILIGPDNADDGVNCNILNYYNGVYLKPVADSDYSPVILYGSSKTPENVESGRIYTGSEIPVGDNALAKIFLKRGHMVTVAENADGTGVSKVYIATDESKEIVLDAALKGKISYLRALPWNYVCKRGLAKRPKDPNDVHLTAEIGTSWFYDWGVRETTVKDMEYVPMFWGSSEPARVEKAIGLNDVTHTLAFNEPDVDNQSNMTVEEALDAYKEILKTGLRVGSPVNGQRKWKDWLPAFVEGCKARNYRIDFIAFHWYDRFDWAEGKDRTPDIDALCERFMHDLEEFHEMFGLPIWITEFNSNPNRLHEIQVKFLEKIIPMLEACPYVERYSYFQPIGGRGKFLESGEPTAVAKAYASIPSTPAIK